MGVASRMSPLLSSLLVRSSCWSARTPSRAEDRLRRCRRSSGGMRISSARLRSSLHLLLRARSAWRARLPAVPVGDADVNDFSFRCRGNGQRGVANVAGLLAEDGAKQLLFRRQLVFHPSALPCSTRMSLVADLCADADDARLVEITQSMLADVGDIARDLFRPSFVPRASISNSSTWIEV